MHLLPTYRASDALPENPFGGLANVPAPVAVMQGKANIVENEIPPEGTACHQPLQPEITVVIRPV